MATLRENRTLASPTVYLDGRRLKVIPNSVDHNIPGEATVRAVSAGAGAVEMVHGIDLTKMVCIVKFECATTAEYLEMAQDYSARRITGELSTIKLVEDAAPMAFDQMILTKQIDVARKTDGNIQFEFMGRLAAV